MRMSISDNMLHSCTLVGSWVELLPKWEDSAVGRLLVLPWFLASDKHVCSCVASGTNLAGYQAVAKTFAVPRL